MPSGRSRPVEAAGTGGFFGSRVAVVTGAGSGIGRALAVELAARGARLALSDIDATGLDETAGMCLQTGAQVHQAVVDVSDWDAMSSYATTVVEEFGRVELVFCLAGIIHTGDLAASNPADVERVLAVNVMGVVHTASVPAESADHDR
jgi:NAD(P)-dependent dehydrogenase (short-subunit alcohol dehydrogenase family)